MGGYCQFCQFLSVTGQRKQSAGHCRTMRHLPTHHTAATIVLFKKTSDYITPLIKCFPQLPRVAMVKCRPCTMTLKQSPHIRITHPSPPLHVCSKVPVISAPQHPKCVLTQAWVLALPSVWGMLLPDLWRAACISNQMPIFREAFLNHPEHGHVTMLSYIILLMAPINAIILLMVPESISVALLSPPDIMFLNWGWFCHPQGTFGNV